jgi:hypothetical protein
VLVGIGFVLLLASVGWNIWLFVQLQNGQSIGSTTTSQQNPATTISVTGVQNVFKQRATQESNYQKNYHFVDPSVPGS